MGFLEWLVDIVDPQCFWVLGLVAVVGFVGIVREWIVRGSEYRRNDARWEKMYERKEAECNQWRDIAVPGLQMAGNLIQAVKNEA